jgi:flavodoxin
MKLVAYFSASGVTRSVAEKLSEKLNADLFEIKPEVLYSESDLNWMNPLSRSSKEMKDKTSRVDFVDKLDSIDKYDTIYVGFPCWWYTCPHIVNSFLEYYDFKNKDVKVFFTSGSTGEEQVKKSLSNYEFISEVIRIKNDEDLERIK